MRVTSSPLRAEFDPKKSVLVPQIHAEIETPRGGGTISTPVSTRFFEAAKAKAEGVREDISPRILRPEKEPFLCPEGNFGPPTTPNPPPQGILGQIWLENPDGVAVPHFGIFPEGNFGPPSCPTHRRSAEGFSEPLGGILDLLGPVSGCTREDFSPGAMVLPPTRLSKSTRLGDSFSWVCPEKSPKRDFCPFSAQGHFLPSWGKIPTSSSISDSAMVPFSAENEHQKQRHGGVPAPSNFHHVLPQFLT